MLNTMFRGNRPADSREEVFLRVFTIYGRGRRHVTIIMSSDFYFRLPESLHKKFG